MAIDDKLLEIIKGLEIGKHIEIPWPKNLNGCIDQYSSPVLIEFCDEMFKYDLVYAMIIPFNNQFIFRKVVGPPMIVLNPPDIDVALKNEVEEMLNRSTNCYPITGKDYPPSPPLAKDVKSEHKAV